ncbi:uncharacterized protein LOC119094511 [Pollicipes pollicipes]|uniref:uncharacterized protein LOC119094511 n=1 Tax=Pollicipes pollicipes TaxID=41117 RepID=UPI00188581CD|nr:uncharacterized protein LOC119094511 [Pollicipes pollicipes]
MVGGSAPWLAPRAGRDRPEVETILQEMRVPVSALVTPLKVNPPPFQFPSSAGKEAPITPLHHTSDAHAGSRESTPREEERRRIRQPPPPPPPPAAAAGGAARPAAGVVGSQTLPVG